MNQVKSKSLPVHIIIDTETNITANRQSFKFKHSIHLGAILLESNWIELNWMEMCSSYRPTDAELTSVIKMKMSLPVIASALLAGDHHQGGNGGGGVGGHSKAASSAMIQLVHQQHPYLPKSDIGNAVAKVLQGYDWSLVPLASRLLLISRFQLSLWYCSLLLQ